MASKKLNKLFPHSSLSSFIDHASRSGLDLKSTVFRGTIHEYSVLEALKPYRFRLTRTGGSDDKGVDLKGIWKLGTEIPVVIQCKNEAKKIGPRYIREMSGMKTTLPGTIAILASTSMYTPLAIRSMITSEVPIALTLFQQYEDGGMLEQLVWNRPAGAILGDLQVRTEHGADGTRLRLWHGDEKCDDIETTE